MTADTTFKEFVEEEGLTFASLDADSRKYRNLVERFNEVKLRLRAEVEARWYESVKTLLNEPSAGKDLHGERRENNSRAR